MSIPLDRLYHYIENVAQEVYGDTIIYHFWPHGSKNIKDLNPIRAFSSLDLLLNPQIFCNDQEPLDFNSYQDYSHFNVPTAVHNELPPLAFKKNLRKDVFNVFDQCILLHSEKNSPELIKYKNSGFITVYYWSHAVIALDWFRYAEHISNNVVSKKNDFLVYNRAWTGTREYRIKFADLLVENNLVDHCKTSLQFYNDQQRHYSEHAYQNVVWQPTYQLENYFIENATTSCYSADFNISDYQTTHCEVVLETLFDDNRIHLTEKILRPIAMGHPFLLCATAGSLQYLRDYGFKTFSSVVDEQYDLITDPVDRLKTIIELMKTIASWSLQEKQQKFAQMQDIANFNKNHFFSDNFFKLIATELKNNLEPAIQQLIQSNTFDRCITLNQHTANSNLYLTWQSQNCTPELIDFTALAYATALNLKQLKK
jgi:hypothetical protein